MGMLYSLIGNTLFPTWEYLIPNMGILRSNVRLKHRISQLDENAIAREKGKTATAERQAQEQATRANREEQRANIAESRLSMM